MEACERINGLEKLRLLQHTRSPRKPEVIARQSMDALRVKTSADPILVIC